MPTIRGATTRAVKSPLARPNKTASGVVEDSLLVLTAHYMEWLDVSSSILETPLQPDSGTATPTNRPGSGMVGRIGYQPILHLASAVVSPRTPGLCSAYG